MEPMTAPRYLLWCVVFLAIALAGCAGTLPASEVGTPKVNTLPPKISPLLQQTKTVCFGRFMIDLPQSAQLVWGPLAVPYEMEVYPGEGPTIEADIKAKVDEIASEKHATEPSMLIGVFDSINPDSKIVVGYESRLDAVFVQLHSYIRLGNTAFVQSIPRSGQGRDDGNGKWILDKTLYKKRVAYLLSIARRLRLRDENEIPNEHGVCIEEGFLAVPLDDRSERIATGFRFPELPDVTFAVETRNTDQPDEYDTLKYAIKGAQAAAVEAGNGWLLNRIETLRMKDRAIGEWKGAEALWRLPSNRDVRESHEFVFISPGVANDLLRPYAKIMFYTGVKDNTRGMVQPSLTDEEAIALWDKLTSTIRVRPVN
jgi:hypothetical protein